jgi:hypothetical protein
LLLFSQELPQTSYYKLIDWWLLFALNMLVLTMCAHTYISHVNSAADGSGFDSARTVTLVGNRRIVAEDGVTKMIAPARTDPRSGLHAIVLRNHEI